VKRRQEEQYRLPYHYVPVLKEGRFAQHYYWHWGFRYLGGIQLVIDQLRRVQFKSLVDIGCGDGRFLHELRQAYPDKRLCGVDTSPRAIGLASALNPDLSFSCRDICAASPEERFDTGTLIEVLEHIEPPRLGEFLDATQRMLASNHILIITVPHLNKPLVAKHYQHFDEARLRHLLSARYSRLEFIPFDAPLWRCPMLWCFNKLLGGRGKFFLVTERKLWFWFYSLYLRRCLYVPDERTCERMAVICREPTITPSPGPSPPKH
jgi:SAM-dependent methyltransferase